MKALVFGLACGVALGGAYFASLWLTARRIPGAHGPAVLVLASYLGRLTLAGLGFYAVVRIWGGGALVAGLVGFLAVRHVLVMRIARTPGEDGAESP